MKFQITNIEFDCSLEEDIFNFFLREGADPDEYWSESDRICTEKKLSQEYIGKVLNVDEEDEIVDLISDKTGWCIKSIDYRHVLS
jgi:hypothetical protein